MLKTRVVERAYSQAWTLALRFLDHHFSPLDEPFEIGPLCVMSGTGEALTHTLLCGVSVSRSADSLNFTDDAIERGAG